MAQYEKLAVYTFVKHCFKTPLTGREITPVDICHSNISVISPGRYDKFLLKTLFWTIDTLLMYLPFLYQDFHHFYRNLRV